MIMKNNLESEATCTMSHTTHNEVFFIQNFNIRDTCYTDQNSKLAYLQVISRNWMHFRS
ncbi:hypothetical protein Hanom_Chr00s000001g01597611 [Helianthus anomalus]